MGKRSNFKRRKADRYMTWDTRAVAALAPHLPDHTLFVEPCAGKGDLIRQLEAYEHSCTYACDTNTRGSFDFIQKQDALTIKGIQSADMTITNPPWSRPLLHAIIEHFRKLGPVWLLFDADWMHTAQAAPYMAYCSKVVSVGRLRWIRGSKMDGKDNCAWYLFGAKKVRTQFIGRQV